MKKLTYLSAMIIAATLPASTLLAQEEHGEMGDMIKGDHPAMEQKMEAQMKAQDAELDKLVAGMNSATGEKKVDAVAAVVNKLVEDRKMMHAQMAGMHENKHGRMMKHGMMEEQPTSSPSPTAR
ncbi:MAG: hypothetical protein ABIR29_11125 [Chthoniobacterales bacterium]